MNDKESIQLQISSLNRLKKIRSLTSEELHDLALMQGQLEEYDH